MINPSDCAKRLTKVVLPFAAAVMCLPTLAAAQEISLQSIDGTVKITGQLVEYENNTYLIEYQAGLLRVDGNLVECFGEACPDTGPLVWDVSLWGKRRAFTEHVEKLAELVAAKTDGDFTLNLSYGDLSPSRENLDGIAAGTFEMAQVCAGYHPEKNPSLNVLELPFLGVTSLDQEIQISEAVYAHPATQADMARWNATLLMPTPLPQQNIMGTGQPPTSLRDFQGMTIRATGGIGDAVASLGAEPVAIPAPQVSEAMKSGDVRAVSFAPHAHMAFGTIEGGTWWTTNLNPGTVNCPVIANTQALASLSDEHRDALMSSLDEALGHYVANYNGKTMDAWIPALRERDVIELTINAQIIASIDEAVAAPAADAWIESATEAGLPAQELYDLVTNIVAAGS